MVDDSIKGFLLLFLILIPLEKIFSLHPQKIFRPGWITDGIYFVIGHFVGKAGLGISLILTVYIFNGLVNPELQTKVAAQPIWLQFIEAVLIGEIGYYTAHRLAHTIPWLWKFHAVHHSSQQLDWLAAVRVHPLDQIFTKTFQVIPLYILGFTKEVFGVYVIFSAFEAFFIHANIKLRFRFIRWLLATPEFHHWHHSPDARLSNTNFAAQLPLLDLLFGTLYMPKNKIPDQYGTFEFVPGDYIGQLLYPFRNLHDKVKIF